MDARTREFLVSKFESCSSHFESPLYARPSVTRGPPVLDLQGLAKYVQVREVLFESDLGCQCGGPPYVESCYNWDANAVMDCNQFSNQ